jgi:mannobiose 2-epimerase
MNEKKSQNTHLHILEAYTNLYRVWQNSLLKAQLKNLIQVFITHIINGNDSHLMLFFDEEWNPKSSLISYGHDIECSWLLHEAVLVTEDENLLELTEEVCIKIAKAADEGYIDAGALLYESDREGKHSDNELEWWVQAEAVVGYLNVYMLTGEQKYLEKACKIKSFIKAFIVDREKGEWFFRITREGIPVRTYEKAGFWKCPYHNARACLEIVQRIDILNA